MTSDSRRYLDPKVLDQVEGLDLQARLIVEGYISGLHQSPFRGFSVEFAEHREYVPGDDIRFLDWKVFGRSRPPLHQAVRGRDEPRGHAASLDVSESMTYRGGRRRVQRSSTTRAAPRRRSPT